MTSSARLIRPREDPATLAEFRAADDGQLELVDGALRRRAPWSFTRSDARDALILKLRASFHARHEGPSGLGGWWIVSDVKIQLDDRNVYIAELAGWRRHNVPEKPTASPMTIRPDWICEVLPPPSQRATIGARKLRTYQRQGVPHLWTVDPAESYLIVQRWTPEGYLNVLGAIPGATIRAEPFEALEWPVGVLFGDDPNDEEAR